MAKFIPTQNTLLDIIEISKKASDDMMKMLDEPIEKNIVRLDNIAIAAMMVLRADEMITIINAQAKNIKGNSADKAMASVNAVVDFVKDFSEPLGSLVEGLEAMINQIERFESQNTAEKFASLFTVLDGIYNIAKQKPKRLKKRLDNTYQVLVLYSEFFTKSEPVLKALIISAIVVSALLDKFYDKAVSISEKLKKITDIVVLKDISLLALISAEYKIMMLFWVSMMYSSVANRIVKELKGIKIGAVDMLKITLIANVLNAFIMFAVLASSVRLKGAKKSLRALNGMLSKKGVLRNLITNIAEAFRDVSFADMGKTIIGIAFIGSVLISVKKLMDFLTSIKIWGIIKNIMTLLMVELLAIAAINVTKTMATSMRKLVNVDMLILPVGIIALKYIFILINDLMGTISKIAMNTMIVNIYRLFIMARVMTSISENLITSHDAIKTLQQKTGIYGFKDTAKFHLKLVIVITILTLISWMFIAASKIKLGFWARRRVRRLGEKVELITTQLETAVAEIERVCKPIAKRTHIIVASIVGATIVLAAMGVLFTTISIVSLPAMIVPVAVFSVYLSIKAIIKLFEMTNEQLEKISGKQATKDMSKVIALIGEVATLATVLTTAGGTIVVVGLKSIVIIPSLLLMSAVINMMIWFMKRLSKQVAEFDFTKSIADTTKALGLIGEVASLAVSLSNAGADIVKAGVKSTIIGPALLLMSATIATMIWFVKRLDKMMSSFDFAKSIADTSKVITLIKEISATAVELSKSGAEIIKAGLKSFAIVIAIPFILLAIASMKYLLLFSRKLLADRRIRNPEKIILKIQTIIGSILALSKTLVEIAAVALAATAAAVTTIALLGVVVVLLVAIKLMAMVTKNLSPMRMGLTMLQLIVLMGIICILALELHLLGLIAKITTPMLPAVGLLLLGIIAITVIIALAGLILAPLQPGIVAAGLCIGIVALTIAIIVVSVLLITLMLKQLEQIELDQEKILENVGVVIGTVTEILKKIFDIQDEKDENGNPKSKGVWGSLLDWIGATFSGVFMIVAAASAMTILVLTAISVGAILIMAHMLSSIQKLDIGKNAGDIMGNVHTVIYIVNHIINSMFTDKNIAASSENGGLLGGIIGLVNPKLQPILNAIFAVAYLAMALIATTIIVLIAQELKLIQKLNIEKTTIISNVTDIFDTVYQIMNVIYHVPKDEAGNPVPAPSGGLFGVIIEEFSPGLKTIIDAIMRIAYLGLSILAISIVIGIAHLLRVLETLPFNKDNVINNVNTIFNTVGIICNKIFKNGDGLLPESKNKGIFGAIIGKFSPGLANISSALTSIAQLGVIAAAISAVKGISEQLKELSDIPIDVPASVGKVKQILDAAAGLCETVFSTETQIKFPTPEEEKQSVFGALIDWFSGTTEEDKALKGAMKKVDRLGVIAAAVGALANIQANIAKIMESNPGNITSATEHVKSIIDASAQLAESIFASDTKFNLPTPSNNEVLSALVDLGFDHWYGSSAAEKAKATQEAQMRLAMKRVEILGVISSALGSMSTIIDYVQKINDTNVADVKTAQERVKTLITSANDIANEILNGQYTKTTLNLANFQAIKDYSNTIPGVIQDIAKQIDGIASIPEDKFKQGLETIRIVDETISGLTRATNEDVKNSKAITENYIRFFKQIENTDLKKLQHTDWLMRSWASISRDLKGDFEGLAKSINANIMPLLEKVNETMEKATECQREIIDELTKPVDIGNTGGAGGSFGSMPSFTNNTSSGGSQSGAGSYGDLGSGSTVQQTPPTGNAKQGQSIPVIVPGGTNEEPETGKKYVVEFKTIKEQ